KEVMAATVLTSLSTSPLILNSAVYFVHPEPASKTWKEVLSTSYSSSTSGNWSWDASDQSVPSTPSPPLSKDSTHFMFEDPIPRKRKKNFKNTGTVGVCYGGGQINIHFLHTYSDYSDGEEDFYYSEIEVNMDSLTEGLSSLTPTSPTTAGPPPIFPPPLSDVSRSEYVGVNGSQSHTSSLLSQSLDDVFVHVLTLSHLLFPRKPRGEAKKCRKVYGMEKRDMWCTACRWKKACQRFTD
uniref:SLC2A4 regulator n=1 Tax=Xiphophorus couchianus TaxID=32473 RepID=A0A3B5LMJ8_9TELE